MRLIGILGGTSWPSTLLPYRLLNTEVQRRLGGFHSARILLSSIDYHPIRSLYGARFDEVAPLLKAEAETLLSRRPDCWMIANNTLHKAYDRIAGELDPAIPFFHAVHLTRDHLVRTGLHRVLLIATRFTMEDGFFADGLAAGGVDVVIPGEDDRAAIQTIQSRLAAGEMDPSFAPVMTEILARGAAEGCAAVVTACTELPLVVHAGLTPMAVVDPLVLQCRACLDFALA
ncbi:aspartate/glutamate racemase family protein [Segnochrobactraceae bacterium EtOH-i3]